MSASGFASGSEKTDASGFLAEILNEDIRFILNSDGNTDLGMQLNQPYINVDEEYAQHQEEQFNRVSICFIHSHTGINKYVCAAHISFNNTTNNFTRSKNNVFDIVNDNNNSGSSILE